MRNIGTVTDVRGVPRASFCSVFESVVHPVIRSTKERAKIRARRTPVNILSSTRNEPEGLISGSFMYASLNAESCESA